jgi:hypothetical protein
MAAEAGWGVKAIKSPNGLLSKGRSAAIWVQSGLPDQFHGLFRAHFLRAGLFQHWFGGRIGARIANRQM